MPDTCCIVGCNSRRTDGKDAELGFYKIPSWITARTKHVSDVTKRRRMAWIAAIRRPNLTFKNTPAHTMVCGKHFRKGKPSYRMLEGDPDWAPSLNLGHDEVKASTSERVDRLRGRILPKMDGKNKTNEELEIAAADHSYASPCCDQCGKSFSSKWSLNVHQRIHTGDKPYSYPPKEMDDSTRPNEESNNQQDLRKFDEDILLNIKREETADFPDPPRDISTGLKEELSDDQDIYPPSDSLHVIMKEEDENLSDPPEHISDPPDNISCKLKEEPTDYQDINSPKEMDPSTGPNEESNNRQDLCKFDEVILLNIKKEETADFPDPPSEISTGLKEEPSDDQDMYPPNDSLHIIMKEEDENLSDPPEDISDPPDNISSGLKEELTDYQDINRWQVFTEETQRDLDDRKGPCCDQCGNSFSSKWSLKVHQRTHTGDKPYSCEYCGKGFSEQGSLIKHLRIHTREKTYSCGMCGKSFTHQSKLNKHLKIHTGEKPYSCEQCGKSFHQQSHLNRHLRSHTQLKPYTCEQCGKTFHQKSNLNGHMRIHTGDRPYSCDYCGNTFGLQSSLRKHLRIHTGEKPYFCEQCGKTFREQSNLNKHLRVHSGKKPYTCEQCGKNFSWKSSINNHMRIHTGDRPYCCNFCGKTFGLQYSLSKHLRIHTGEKPYFCEKCGKTFREQSNLNKHLRVHSGEKPYTCEECGNCFTALASLKKHRRIHMKTSYK